jgi:Zn-finger nucleic acid-binding protein
MEQLCKGGSAMICPRCGALLKEVTRGGVPVDMCELCLGVWLDRGDLKELGVRLWDPEEDLDRRKETPQPSLEERWRKMSSIFVE